MNPTNGEILSLASYPTFDPNLFSQRIGTPEGRREANALLRDTRNPLYNRAIKGRYPPGSTWKIPMAMSGLEAGRDHGQELEPRVRRRHHHRQQVHALHGQPRRAARPLRHPGLVRRLLLPPRPQDEARRHPEDGRGLRAEQEDGRRSAARAGELDALARVQGAASTRRDPEWRDIDTVYASFGQVLRVRHAAGDAARGRRHRHGREALRPAPAEGGAGGGGGRPLRGAARASASRAPSRRSSPSRSRTTSW